MNKFVNNHLDLFKFIVHKAFKHNTIEIELNNFDANHRAMINKFKDYLRREGYESMDITILKGNIIRITATVDLPNFYVEMNVK